MAMAVCRLLSQPVGRGRLDAVNRAGHPRDGPRDAKLGIRGATAPWADTRSGGEGLSMRVYEGGSRREYEETLRSIGAALDRHAAMAVPFACRGRIDRRTANHLAVRI